MEAIGQLAGGIAHDFNNILSAIIGYGHILQMKMNGSDPLRMNVQHLLEAADRAAHLTHSLLAFSRKQIINPADVELNEIIPRIDKFLRRIIGEDIDLRKIFKKDRITVHADSSQLEQMLLSSASTAIATARYVLPVPAGPMPKVMSWPAMLSRYTDWFG